MKLENCKKIYELSIRTNSIKSSIQQLNKEKVVSVHASNFRGHTYTQFPPLLTTVDAEFVVQILETELEAIKDQMYSLGVTDYESA